MTTTSFIHVIAQANAILHDLTESGLDEQAIREKFDFFNSVDVKKWLADEKSLPEPAACVIVRGHTGSEYETTVNRYKIKYNSHWNEFQTSHDDIGFCEGFGTLDEAVIYCRKG